MLSVHFINFLTETAIEWVRGRQSTAEIVINLIGVNANDMLLFSTKPTSHNQNEIIFQSEFTNSRLLCDI